MFDQTVFGFPSRVSLLLLRPAAPAVTDVIRVTLAIYPPFSSGVFAVAVILLVSFPATILAVPTELLLCHYQDIVLVCLARTLFRLLEVSEGPTVTFRS